MKKFTRALALAMAVLMVFVLAACTPAASTPTAAPTSAAGGASTPAPTAGTATQTAAPVEPVAEREFYEISAYINMHPSASLDDVPEGGYMKEKMFEEMFNVKFDFIRIPATDEQAVYNVTMASGDIPDIVTQGSWSSLNKYKEAWKPLDDYILGKYEYLEDYFYNDPFVYALSAGEDGKIKILSMLSEQYIGDILLVRGDLVEAWGLNIDDYKVKEDYADLLRFAQQQDPKLVPFMTRMQTVGLINRLCESWSGICTYEFVDQATDTVMYGAADPRMKEVVEWLRVLYAEKLIDQEFPTTATPEWQEQLLNDGIFMTHDNASSRIKWADQEFAKLGVTDKYYQAMPLIQPDANTKGTTTIHYPKLRDAFAVFVGVEDGKVDRIMEMSNYNFSPEGFELHTYGIDGISFFIDSDGLYQHVPEYDAAIKADDRVALPMDKRVSGDVARFGRLEPNGIYGIDNRQHERVQAAAVMYEDGGLIRDNKLQLIRLTEEEQSRATQLKTDLETYTQENIVQFIMGIKSMDQWDAFVADYSRIGEGLDTFLQIYNDAYTRAKDLLN
ncbi:MAG: hypothetical protein ACOX8S_06220 [Christensenellales bacterium]|jgi:putative aldouronate transport system substrate-binding protein